MRYADKVPHYKTGAQITQEWKQKDPNMQWPVYDTGGMLNNLFLKPPGWRAAEGFSQPALGYPDAGPALMESPKEAGPAS